MTAPRRVRPAGDRALLLEFADTAQVRTAHATLAAQKPQGVRDVVPGALTLLVVSDRTAADTLRFAIDMALDEGQGPVDPETKSAPINIAARYDGDDLHAVAAQIGVSVEEVVARHTAALYTAQFCGFAPGFVYLSGLDPLLYLPRLDTPRTAVPSGSVAIADRYTGIYPRPSPGGWHLLARTQAELFDPDRDPPALLSPGSELRFTAQ
ncbi:allophanate hydrolase subunit 1 [Streptomyces sp. NBC_01506]|uniref:5-oxoprolinase subunit B family protein n=1 Tax=Streptomyces sp. NBC_01506 TaxID=2903887 RepID=UPI0038684B91